MNLRKINTGHPIPVRRGFWFLTTWEFYTAKTKRFRLESKQQYEQALADRERLGVARIGRDGGRVCWWSSSGLWWADSGLSAQNVADLIWERERRQANKLQRLRKMRASNEGSRTERRQRIPDDVKLYVWERDEGRCRNCGADEDLQYDHIIPVAKGGGNSHQNIQLLCGNCNRQKSDNIA